MNTRVSFVYLTRDNQVLILQEGSRLAIGLWCLPGGHVDGDESFEEAAIREAFEEAGFKITLEKEIYKTTLTNTEYKGMVGDTEQVDLVIFKGNIIGGELQIDEQALDLKWLSKEAAIKLPLRWSFLKDIILNN